jgi:ferrous iron transport protein A
MFTQGFSVYYSPLNFLATKTQGVITAIRNKDDQIINKILAMGVDKGMQITLEQDFPSFVIRVGQTQMAIDQEVASSIKVRVTTRN